MTIPVFISVRIDSSRLPAKCLLEISRGMTVLLFVVSRSRHFGLRPVICTDQFSFDNGLKDLIITNDVDYVVGPKENKLKRWCYAAEKYGIDKFHSVDADDPFFCHSQVEKSFVLLKSSDEVICPSEYSDSGGATEGYSLFKNSIDFSKGLADEVDTSFIKPYLKGLKSTVLKNPDYAKCQTRLTLDYLEDYCYLRKLGYLFQFSTPRSEIEEYIIDNQYLSNVHLNDMWKKRQLLEGQKNYHE